MYNITNSSSLVDKLIFFGLGHVVYGAISGAIVGRPVFEFGAAVLALHVLQIHARR
jgi:hypothetical protein